jgi:thiol-disulfide isomerase/thioredoxin
MLERSTGAVLVVSFLVFTTSLGAVQEPKSPTPRERYEATLKDYEAANTAWEKSGAKIAPTAPTTPLWIKHYAEQPKWAFAPRFLQIATDNRHDPAALDALLKLVESGGGSRAGDRFLFASVKRAVDILISDHLQDERVIRTCLTVAPFGVPGLDAYFRALLAESRDREVLGRACMALVRCNDIRIGIAKRPWFDLSEGHPDLLDATKYIIGRLDPNYISSARTADQAALRAESEALLERVINEFGDILLAPKWAKVKPDGRTLADSARPKLEAMRSLAVGRVAPEIEGQDIDGKPMKLSDYRGKVVVLCFWGTWCGPCMAMVPLEKALVERLKVRPFVLLGINSDSDREKLKSVMAEKGMTWRSWWDSGRTGGPIATRWDVHVWPAIIVLDGKGVIRFRGLPHHVAKPLDDAVDSLLEEMKR